MTATNKKYKVSKRTSSYVKKTLGEFEQLMMLGYTHENFNAIGRCLSKISGHMFLDEVTKLKELWRDTYTMGCDQYEVNAAVEEIQARF